MSIEMAPSQQLRYTGYFSNKDLNKALTNVCAPLGLAYSFDEKEGTVRIEQETNGSDGP